MKLLILGAGGHGQVVKEVAAATGLYSKIDFLDDNNPLAIGKIDEYENFAGEYEQAFIGIGNNKLRSELYKKITAAGYCVPVIIHPTAYISPTAKLGAGTIVEPKALVNASTLVGEGCIISVGSVVDHDCTVGNFCHINAGAVIRAMSVIDDGLKVSIWDILGV